MPCVRRCECGRCIARTTLLVNSWLDIPLIELWRPVQYLGGLGRQPRLRRWLEPGSFFLGWGVGLSVLEIDGSDNVALSGSDDIYDFAWNVGAGVNYALTDKVDLSIGYRYLGLGKQKIDLDDGGGAPGGDVEFDPDVHEFRMQIRVEVYDPKPDSDAEEWAQKFGLRGQPGRDLRLGNRRGGDPCRPRSG